MKIILEENLDSEEVVAELRTGATLVYPTETCYGLGCDATNADAVARVFAIKKRQGNKPVLMVMPNVEMLIEYVEWNETLENLAQKYWPGPLTVVAPLKAGVKLPPGVVGEDGTIAFRVTSHPLPVALAQALGRPLVSTSANLAAHASPYEFAAVISMFATQLIQPDILIDAGALPHRSPTTIVRLGAAGEIEILRQGDLIVIL